MTIPMSSTAVDTGNAGDPAAAQVTPGAWTAGGDAAAAQASWMKRTDEAVTSTQAALAASAVVAQLETSFPAVAGNRFAKAALGAAPLLLMKRPPNQESGYWGLLCDPKVLGIAAVAGVVVAKEVMQKAKEMVELRFSCGTAELEKGTQLKLHIDAFDESGGRRPAGESVTFASNKPYVLDINSEGVVTAKEEGMACITATMEGKSDMVMVKVTPAHHGNQEHHSHN